MNKYFIKIMSAAVVVVVCGSVSLHAQNPQGNSHRAAALPFSENTKPVMVEVTNPAGTESIKLTYTLPEADIKSTGSRLENTELYEVSVGNTFQKGNEGEPVLPVIPVQVIIPAGHSFDKVVILDSKSNKLSGSHRIRHGQANIPLIPGVRQKVAEPKADIYSSDNVYPPSIVEMIGIQYKKGVAIAFLQLHPVAYQPKSGKISVCSSISFELKLKAATSEARLKPNPKDLNPATLQVENPEAIDTYNQGSITPQDESVSPLGICDPSQSFRYVVVTADSFFTATTDYTIRDLVAQKQSRGISATIVTTENVFANYTGVDNAERLRNFIIDAYTNWETEYVLLGGDINIIPMRKLYCNASGEVDDIPSDLYYQCLDGNYNSDNDSHWGETTDGPGGTDVDLMAEVYIGRASAENKNEMANFVYKTLAYENSPENSSYLRRALMVGEYLGFGGVSEYATGSMEEIRLGSSASGYTTTGFASSPLFSVDTLYDRSGYDWPASDILSRMSSGTYGIYNHLGHANYNYVMKFYNASADALTNNNFFFAYSQGCIPGNFEEDCIAEHLTTSNRHGAYAVVFNSRYGWGQFNSTDGPSQRFDRQFWDAYFGEFMTNLGALNADSHEDNIWDINGDCIRWCYYETNLLGDPQTTVRGRLTGPSLAYSSHTISDLSGGNGDGLINPGESIDITLTASNIGTESATGVTATVSESDPYVTITTGTATFGTIQCCGATREAQTPVRLSIASGCPTPRTVTLSCLLRDSRDSTWSSTFSITVYTSSQVSGFVRTVTGSNPVAGATVSFSGPVSGSVTTTASGAYMFGGIDGTYRIVASASNYLASDTQVVTVPPGQQNINFALKQAPRIAVSPRSFNKVLFAGDSVSDTMVITNTVAAGNGDLQFTIDITNGALITNQDPPSLIYPEKLHNSTDEADVTGSNQLLLPLKPSALPGKTFTSSNLKILCAAALSDTTQISSLVQGLRSLSNVSLVTILSCYSSIPNLAYLQEYDIVVVISSSSWADPALIGNTLADYIDAGGKVCILNASFCNSGNWALSGRIMTSTYSPFTVNDYSVSSATSADFESHFITNGVNTITTDLYSYNSTLQGKSISLGKFTNGYHVAAYNPDKPIVAINVYPINSYWGGDLVLMMGNSFDYLSGSQWLTVSPSSGTVAPGDSAIITLAYNAQNMSGGSYPGMLSIIHNASNEAAPLLVPCTLTVDGMRRLSARPVSIDFDNIWVGMQDSVSLRLINSGDEATIVNSISLSNANFSVPGSLPLTVPPLDSIEVKVLFQPGTIGNHNGTITINSNAEDNPSISVSVSGSCVQGPQISISTKSFHETLIAGDSVTKSLTIENSGDDTLKINGLVHINQQQTKRRLPVIPISTHEIKTTSGKSVECTFSQSFPAIKDTIAVAVFGNSNTSNLSSLLSNSGYRSQVLTESNINSGALQNYDVLVMMHNTSTLNSATQQSITNFVSQGGGLVTEWCSSTLLFSAAGANPYNVQTPQWRWFQGTVDYGNEVGTGTAITITDPSSNVVSGISSPFSAGGATEFFYTLSGYSSQLRVIATYNGHNGTWPALLEGKYGAGCVVIHQFDSGDDLSSTVIQRLWTNSVEQAKTGAIQQWLSISTDSIRIAPHTTSTIHVKFNTVNLQGGDHFGAISIHHNVPDTISPLSVPCTLTVDGFRRLSVSPSPLNFGSLWTGMRDTLPLKLINSGNEATQVITITSNNEVFTISQSLPVTVPAFDSIFVSVVYQPTTIGVHNGTIVISSDAEDNPSISISCSGTGTTPPVASVRPDSLYYNLLPSDAPSTQVCYVRNTGGDTLNYHIQGINQLSSPLAVAPASAVLPEIRNDLIYSSDNIENEFINGRVIIAMARGFSSPSRSILDNAGYTTIRELGVARNPRTGKKLSSSRQIFLVTLSDTTKDGVLNAVAKLKNEPSIAYVEPDYVVKAYVTPNDTYFSQLYAMFNNGQTGGTVDADIDATEVWDRHTGNRSKLIGIIDTGIDYLHPDLAANIWTNPGEIAGNGIDDDNNGFIDDMHGWDFAYDDNNPTDGHYHGTHCAGTIAGVGNNGIGVTGVMWTASLVALKFLDDGGSGSTSDAIDAVNYANAMGIQITSNSWGGGGFSQALMDVISVGGLFVAAAGNDGADNDASPHYPSSYALDNIIAVAATDHSDLLASFSCYGRTSVDLGAPGVSIYSCSPSNSYRSLSGTSMATPHVSGSAGLIWTYNPFLSASQVKQLLLDNVDRVSSLNGRCVTGGRLNIDKALRAAGPTWLTASPMAGGKVAPGDSAIVSVTVTPTGLVAGRYEGEIIVGTDDPINRQLRVAATADIAAFRNLSALQSSLTFGSVWSGSSDTMQLTLRNTGNAPTVVSSISTTNSTFRALAAFPLTVPSNQTVSVKIVFAPLSSGIQNGTLTISSNAQDNPSIELPLHGTGIEPPAISISPSYFDIKMRQNDSLTRPLSISNAGGDSLSYSISIIDSTAAAQGSSFKRSLFSHLMNNFNSDIVRKKITGPSGIFINSNQPVTINNQETMKSFRTQGLNDGKNVLIFRDNLAWGVDVNVPILTELGATISVATSSEMSTIDLSTYDLILFEAQQTSSFYSTYIANMRKFEQYLYNGGKIQFHCATYSTYRVAQLPFPGGMSTTSSAQHESTNYAKDRSHPVLTNGDSILSGNYASHEGLQNVPPSAKVIVVNTQGNPTVVEYTYGAGSILVSGMTWEVGYSYGWNSAIPLLTNALSYMLSITSRPSWISVASTEGTVPPEGKDQIDVLFNSTDIDTGIYHAIINVAHNAPFQTSPIQISVTLWVGENTIRYSGSIISIGTSVLPISSGTRFQIFDLRAGSVLAGRVQGNRYTAILK